MRFFKPISMLLISAILLGACGGVPNFDSASPEAKATAQAQLEADQKAFDEWLLKNVGQFMVDNSISVSDLAIQQVTGKPVCRRPHTASEEEMLALSLVDAFGMPLEGEFILCGWSPLDQTSADVLKADVMLVSVSLIGTPGFPIDDIIFIGKLAADTVVAVSAAALASWLATLPVYGMSHTHTNDSHNPNKKNALARVVIAGFGGLLELWRELTGGPDDPEHQCGAILNAAGAVWRIGIWIVTKTGPVIVSLDPSNRLAPYISAYYAGKEVFLKGPKQSELEKYGRSWVPEWPCPGKDELPNLQKASN